MTTIEEERTWSEIRTGKDIISSLTAINANYVSAIDPNEEYAVVRHPDSPGIVAGYIPLSTWTLPNAKQRIQEVGIIEACHEERDYEQWGKDPLGILSRLRHLWWNTQSNLKRLAYRLLEVDDTDIQSIRLELFARDREYRYMRNRNEVVENLRQMEKHQPDVAEVARFGEDVEQWRHYAEGHKAGYEEALRWVLQKFR